MKELPAQTLAGVKVDEQYPCARDRPYSHSLKTLHDTPSLSTMHHFIDPASLSPAPESEAGSPAPSASGSNPRKRPRTETTSEERKEARAHRNRIAAQNSRDRRKAQYSYLERRVAELEDENRALRSARGVPLLPISASTSFKAEEEHKRLETSARERENEELKERIKTLERGWDAVIKALAAQGVPLAAPAPPTPTSTVAPPPIYPISPAPSHSSLDFSPTSSSSPSALPLDTPSFSEQQQESTRHLARVATIDASRRMSLQRVDSISTSVSYSPAPQPPHLLQTRIPLLAIQARQLRPNQTTPPWKTSSWRSSPRPSLLLRPRVLLQRPPVGLPRKRPGSTRHRLRVLRRK
ncbi:hypothetical protein FPV67DRAFT_1560995 [Lyophyllum atratum]|nr:hypothetical protein FPV67DRAFT_1560995 [Lyophyllum atratum]